MILVLNCGSTSIKYKIFRKETEICSGFVDKIGEEISNIVYKGKKICKKKEKVKNHEQAIRIMLDMITHEEYGVIRDLSEISAVGHRVVHGGPISQSVLIDEDVIKEIETYAEFAPLHNPANLKGIKILMKILHTPHVAVFDTAFHQTIPKTAAVYAIPYKYYKKGIRRYGFHGTSHKYVSIKAAELLGKPLNKLNLITCHLGAGCSITAVKNGKSIDTSMGFTPLEGLVMATRSGDIDPAIVLYLIRNEGMKPEDVDMLLNKRSGLFALSGLSKEMRQIIENLKKERCKLAVDAFVYRLKKYIGAYNAILNKADAIVFTAGIGENSPFIRERVCKNLLGIVLDKKRNMECIGKPGIISSPNSEIAVLVVPTNEELMIAKETEALI